MQYHCLSLLEAGYSVDLVAYGGRLLYYAYRGMAISSYKAN